MHHELRRNALSWKFFIQDKDSNIFSALNSQYPFFSFFHFHWRDNNDWSVGLRQQYHDAWAKSKITMLSASALRKEIIDAIFRVLKSISYIGYNNSCIHYRKEENRRPLWLHIWISLKKLTVIIVNHDHCHLEKHNNPLIEQTKYNM